MAEPSACWSLNDAFDLSNFDIFMLARLKQLKALA